MLNLLMSAEELGLTASYTALPAALNVREVALEPQRPLLIRGGASSQLLTRWQPAAGEQAPLADFLAACCERHPRAWCRAADLWNAYQQWVEREGERYPLSRRAFAQALKQLGCSPARTNAYRTWRGIALRATP